MTWFDNQAAEDPQLALHRALGHLKRGELQQARGILERLKTQAPGNADVLQLLGGVAKSEGRLREARTYFEQSLAIVPMQPHVHNNLGNVHTALNDHAAAEPCYRRALQQKPDYGDAQYNLGISLFKQKRFTDAHDELEKAVRQSPKDPKVLTALGRAAKELGRIDEAIKHYDAALKADSNFVGALHNKGVALNESDRGELAMPVLRKALKLAPSSPETWTVLGNVCWRLNYEDEAIKAFRRALDLNPLDTDVHVSLNKILFTAGRHDEYLQSYYRVLAQHRGHPEISYKLAHHLFKGDKLTEAEQVLREALTLNTQSVGLRNYLVFVLASQLRADEAAAEAARLISANPKDFQVLLHAGIAELARGDGNAAMTILQRAVAVAPDDQAGWAYLMAALRLAGQDYRWLYDYDRFVSPQLIDVPPGYPDHASFNAALKEDLERLHVSREHPYEQTLRQGTQTLGELFHERIETVQLLKQSLERSIERYVATMPVDASHPLLRRKTRNFIFSGAWSVRLRNEGYHLNHTHPQGWISSAYYVSLPEEVKNGHGGKGWIKFGEPGTPLRNPLGPDYIVRPQEGMLVLFPSYMWHGTIPFESQDHRITVAFDVVPAASGA